MKPADPGQALVHAPCGACGATEGRPLYRGRPLAIESLGHPRVTVTQCERCGFLYNSPRPSEEVLERFYAGDRLASGRTFREEDERGYYPALFAQRAEFYAPFLRWASERRGPGRLLDVGCGRGGFLSAMRARLPEGWTLAGLEPCADSAAAAREKGFDVQVGRLGGVPLEAHGFDAVSLISVLEHLTNPDAALAEVVRLLVPGGLLVLEVPNVLHPEPSLTSYFGIEHVAHFSPGSLCRLLEAHGVGEMRLDDRVRDHGLRLVAGADLAQWGCTDPERFEDDRERAALEVLKYVDDERRLLSWIDRHVRATLHRWVQEERRIAVYGAGVHTVELAECVDLGAVHFLVDGDPGKHGTRVADLPVHAPEALRERAIDAVLISSARFADEMEATVRALCPPGVELARCYPPDPSNLAA